MSSQAHKSDERMGAQLDIKHWHVIPEKPTMCHMAPAVAIAPEPKEMVGQCLKSLGQKDGGHQCLM